jgi:hypothetical protein
VEIRHGLRKNGAGLRNNRRGSRKTGSSLRKVGNALEARDRPILPLLENIAPTTALEFRLAQPPGAHA